MTVPLSAVLQPRRLPRSGPLAFQIFRASWTTKVHHSGHGLKVPPRGRRPTRAHGLPKVGKRFVYLASVEALPRILTEF
jgi:hypothetical protein